MGETSQTVIVRQSGGNPGVLAGFLGCALGILGIFTLGIVFVPLAALCSGIGLLRGLIRANASGIGVSLLGVALSAVGFVVSPGLWIAFALFIGSLLVAAPSTRQAVVTQSAPSYRQQQPPAPAPNSIEAMNRAKAEATAAIQQCRQMRLSGQLKSYVASAECSSPRVIEAYQRAGYRYMDIVYFMEKGRHAIAERTDRGLITDMQSTNEYAQVVNQARAIERQRDSGQASLTPALPFSSEQWEASRARCRDQARAQTQAGNDKDFANAFNQCMVSQGL